MDDQSHIVAAEAAVTAVLETATPALCSRAGAKSQHPLPYCENCGAPMAGPFCAQCGQAAIDYRRSFRHVIVDVLGFLPELGLEVFCNDRMADCASLAFD